MLPYNLLPEPYAKHAFIAGGYAACPALATDIDVWVTVPVEPLDEARADILRHLRNQATYEITEQEDNRVGITTSSEGYEVDIQIRKVAKVVDWQGTVYHIIVTEGDVDRVLRSFDISTHQVALLPYGVVTGPDWTPITVPPVRLKDTPTTNARLYKIAERYGHVDYVAPVSLYSVGVL